MMSSSSIAMAPSQLRTSWFLFGHETTSWLERTLHSDKNPEEPPAGLS